MAEADASGSKPDPTKVEQRIDRAAGFFSNIKTLLGMVAALLVGVFVAGMYFSDGIESVSNALAKISAHDEQLILLTKGAGQLRTDIDNTVSASAGLVSELRLWSPVSERGAVTGLPGGVQYGTSMCPDGFYMVGIQSWGSPGSTRYCIGCLVAAQVICKPLNVAN